MLFVSDLVLLFISVTFAFDSLDPPVAPPIDGSKFAFIKAPYVNTLKIQKDLVIEDDVSSRWTNGIVTYYVDRQSYDDIFEALLGLPIHIIQRSSCIEFKKITEKPSDKTLWINITNPSKEQNCNHEPLFKNTGEIELVFGYDCLTMNEMVHTLLHGIGIKDEVTHVHRDKYIRILWDNIQPAYQHLYRMQAVKPAGPVVEYDPLSVMHFHSRAFSKNGHATIAPLEPGLVISPSDTLSQLDKMRLQMYFGHECKKRQIIDLLNTCKKSLGPKYLNKKKPALYCGEGGREIDTEDKEEEEEVEDDKGQDITKTEGQVEVAESLDVEDPDVKVQGMDVLYADGTNAGGKTVEEQNAEGQNTNDQVEEGKFVKGKYSKLEDAGSHDEGSKGNEKAVGEVDEENEENLNAGTENPAKMESEKKVYNFTAKTLELSYNQKISDEDSDANAVLSYKKYKYDKKQSLDGESEINNSG